jgi:peptidoglycan hydrolase-like protein with peptidoglycan-binding domain
MHTVRRALQGIAIVFILLSALVLGLGALTPASAQTADSISVQIAELTAKLAALQEQLRKLTDPVPPVLPTEPHRVCGLLARTLSQGVRGNDVQALQEFLYDEGYLSAKPNGSFGPATAAAVSKWQSQQGLPAAGLFGIRSREHVKQWCANYLHASPRGGAAPLVVRFTAQMTLANSNFVADAGDYKIDFGDGTEQKLACVGSEPFCKGPHTATHEYKSEGTYTARLIHYGYFGPVTDDVVNGRVVSRAEIRVGGMACTKEYKPVCGGKQVVCITAPCDPIPQTYGNSCMMEADGAKFLYEGQCQTTVYDPAKDPRCKSWNDGCNVCSRDSANSAPYCTLRACLAGATAKPYCTAWFDTGNKAPVVISFSGPTTLSVNETGMWTIVASDAENGPLTYEVSWDDAKFYSAPASTATRESSTQKTSFTHAYGSAGTYTITIRVIDNAGSEAKTTTTVKVGATGRCISGGVVYPEGTRQACVEYTNGHRVCIADAVYVCRAGDWRVEGGFGVSPQPTICTADAMQCPNGTWIGRSGPNCQFVCPN